MELRLVQYVGRGGTRSVIAATDEGGIFVMASMAPQRSRRGRSPHGCNLACTVATRGTGGLVDLLAELHAGLRPSPIDHVEAAHLIMTGTGLTHLGSAGGRESDGFEIEAAPFAPPLRNRSTRAASTPVPLKAR